MIKVVTPTLKKAGGPGVFMSRLLQYMQDHDMVRVVDSGGDVYFSTVWGDKTPARYKHVYRAAAAYYNTNQRRRHGLNKRIAKSIKKADHVVFQTWFARDLCQKILKSKARKFTIINNGFDAPVSSTPNDGPPVFVACANWKDPAKRGGAIIKAFTRANIENSKLILIGPNISSGRDRVKCVGATTEEGIIQHLRRRPFFIHLCYAEACPNVVVEALSFGCPIICNNIGGTPEIVKDSGVIANCDALFVFARRDINVSRLNIGKVVESIRDSVNRTWNISRPDLSMKVCASSYLSVFKEVVSS